MRIGLLFLLLAFSLSTFSAHAEIYRWVDAEGRVMYGDDPPNKSAAKPVNLPMLTVADGFVPQKTQQAEPVKEEDEAYSDFRITSPTADEPVRANDGNLTVSIGLKPKLKAGDGITLYLDSRQVASGSELSFPLTELERGEHTVFAVLNDASGNIIQNTESVKFSVLQNSALQKSGGDSSNEDAQESLQSDMFGSQPQAPSSPEFSFPTLPGQ
ncbi:MAG: DUF4124 domain-containing protein [Gammaproteobacteria bacterium]|nr:DUF4124 domain-containing protein [Gammaproteobacteria bacterium]MBU1723514.1 DUF4124 domain-containing protein [Gammaproteobacteria bacterium]MBU2004072.1 DUF4124 domain-containing protein [Gammaproteobacteria bacterium]